MATLEHFCQEAGRYPGMLGVGSYRELLPAESYSWHSGTAACLETELFLRTDRCTVPWRPSIFAFDSGWSHVCSRHPAGPVLVDRLSRFEQRRRPWGPIGDNFHLDEDLLLDHNDLLDDLRRLLHDRQLLGKLGLHRPRLVLQIL